MSAINQAPIVIPDQILVDTLNTCLDIIRDDYNSVLGTGKQNESLLYLLLYNTSIGKYNFLREAVKIFVTTPEKDGPKHMEVKLSYDHTSEQAMPGIFVSLPSENTVNNSIGIGEGDQEELIMPRNASEQDEYRAQYMRRYLATYHIIIVCENRNEMLVIYHVMKSMITACINHLSIGQNSLSNIKIGGQDLIRLPGIPDRAFKRAITLSFEYEQVVPSLVIKKVYRKLRLFWKPEGATTASGPIEVEVDDELISSSSESA